MTAESPFYRPSELSGPLRQGEILTNVVQMTLAPGFQLSDEDATIKPFVYPMAIIVSQDCDLDVDLLSRRTIENEAEKRDDKEFIDYWQSKQLSQVLFCTVYTKAQGKAAIKKEDGNSWDRLKKNDDFRFHYLQKSAKEEDLQEEGLTPLVVSFKNHFTVRMDDLLARISSGETKRRFYMESPYFEHVSDRFSYYIARVGLPRNHK